VRKWTEETMNILVTGGAGYIGSHTVRELLAKGYWPITYDNLSEGHREAVLGGDFVRADLSDEGRLRETFEKYPIDAVMHFAASCLVGESVRSPQKYYRNNVTAGLNLLRVMLEYKVKRFVFSSTAAVYGEPKEVPIFEGHPLTPINPYGRSKAMFEKVLADCDRAYGLKYISLRYFNAAGAHPEGKIGEDHNPETHLTPLVLQAALEVDNPTNSFNPSTADPNKAVKIFGANYPTPDGTCIRDYVHVTDLANAHILALEFLKEGVTSQTFNLGNGDGYSVREVIEVANKVTRTEIPVIEEERRSGDPAVLVASSEKIKRELGWRPQFPKLERIIESAWMWHKRNPEGFGGK
jgi:UDP-glucose 4-epimerase